MNTRPFYSLSIARRKIPASAAPSRRIAKHGRELNPGIICAGDGTPSPDLSGYTMPPLRFIGYDALIADAMFA